MFTASAELYDLIYSGFKDYSAETSRLADLIRRECPSARTVLDVACGTAEHARLLTEEHGFAADALDIDPAFVRIASRKLSRGVVYQADMASFDIQRRWDVIACLFSSIGYVRTLENVTRTLNCFRHHLAAGGVVLVEPWFPPGVLEAGRVTIQTAETPDTSIVRMSCLEIRDRISRIRFEYLIGRTTGIERETEVHELGLFTTEEMTNCFHQAGLKVSRDSTGLDGRGLFIARAN